MPIRLKEWCFHTQRHDSIFPVQVRATSRTPLLNTPSHIIGPLPRRYQRLMNHKPDVIEMNRGLQMSLLVPIFLVHLRQQVMHSTYTMRRFSRITPITEMDQFHLSGTISAILCSDTGGPRPLAPLSPSLYFSWEPTRFWYPAVTALRTPGVWSFSCTVWIWGAVSICYHCCSHCSLLFVSHFAPNRSFYSFKAEKEKFTSVELP